MTPPTTYRQLHLLHIASGHRYRTGGVMTPPYIILKERGWAHGKTYQ